MSSSPREGKVVGRHILAHSANVSAPVVSRLPSLDTPAHLLTETDIGVSHWPSTDTPPVSVGGMTVVREIGRGGMGWVLEVEDPKLRRRVAVKLMLPGVAADPVSRQRFLREARAQAAVEHENVAVIHAIHDEADPPYIVMPLLKGRSLADRLAAAGGPLPLTDIFRVAAQMASGLAAAHAGGLIHRDVKPSNVWLEGEKGRVKLLDFGLARFADGADDRLSRTGDLIGTPAYMAPEQAGGQPVDHRADLFSLGCVMYEMATGRRPFNGDSLGAIIISLVTETPPPAKSLNRTLPSALSHLIHQLLDKTPARRSPNTAAGVVARLKQIAAELTVNSTAGRRTPRPASPVEVSRTAWRKQIPVKRTPAAAGRWVGRAVAAAAAVGVFGGLVALTLFVARPNPAVASQNPAPVEGPPVVELTPLPPKPEPQPEPPKEKPPAPVAVVPPVVVAPAPGREPPADVTPPKGWPFNQVEADDELLKWAEKLNLGVREDLELGGGVKLTLRLIPPGEYEAGPNAAAEPDRDPSERTKKVVIRQPFYAGQFEVTRAQYEQVMGGNGLNPQERQLPASGVTWDQAQRFCEAASRKNLGKWRVRLPTEAEWEWMARAGTATRFHTGDGLSAEAARSDEESPWKVGSGQANAFGLFDVHGNVWEWCQDKVGAEGAHRAVRGGSWKGVPKNCRSATRWSQPPGEVQATIGFRVVAEPVGK